MRTFLGTFATAHSQFQRLSDIDHSSDQGPLLWSACVVLNPKTRGHSNEESMSAGSLHCVPECHGQTIQSNGRPACDVADGSSKRDPLFVDTLRIGVHKM